jgi:hypothetical protein
MARSMNQFHKNLKIWDFAKILFEEKLYLNKNEIGFSIKMASDQMIRYKYGIK